MDYQQKAAALEALSELTIKYRSAEWRIGSAKPWYCSCDRVEVKDNSILKGVGGDGLTPQEAIEDYWEQLTVLKPHEYIVVRAYQDVRRAVRWNGFMWADVPEPSREKAA